MIRHRRQKAITARHRLQARIKQQKRSSAIRILRLPILEALIPHQRRLLVSDDTSDRHALERTVRDVPVYLGGRDDLGQDGGAEVEEFEHGGRPLEGLDVHEEGARGVGDVDVVQTAVDAAGQGLLVGGEGACGRGAGRGIGKGVND